MIAEFVGGLVSGSVAIMTDAAHMFSDVSGFLIQICSIRLARRLPTNLYSFGYHRSEVLGALASIVIIWALVVALFAEAIIRTREIVKGEPYDIDAKIMLILAVVSLLCNIFNLIALGECCIGQKADEEKNNIKELDGNVIKIDQVKEI
jgi:zinc transporter 2